MTAQIKFIAKVIVFVRLEKAVTKKRFLTLGDDSRRHHKELFNKKIYNHYFEILPPSLNVKIREIKKKLEKYKIFYIETFEDDFVIIRSVVK